MKFGKKDSASPPISNYAFSEKDTLVHLRQIKDEFREKEYLLNLTLKIANKNFNTHFEMIEQYANARLGMA